MVAAIPFSSVPNMEHHKQNDALIRLLSAEGIGHGIASRLISRFGTPEAVLEADKESIATTCDLSEEAARLVGRAIHQSDPAREQEL